jgi:stage II sporulation protein D
MHGKIRQIVTCVLLLMALAPAAAQATAVPDNPTVRIGLYFGDGALPSANLENSTGSGYRFGYFDADRDFHQLGTTDDTQITMLKNKNMYLSGGAYSETPSPSAVAVGCYHIQLPGSYAAYAGARTAANARSGAFPVWISGAYSVRVGAYTSKEAAQAAQAALNLSGSTIAGPGDDVVTVANTRTGEVLFQFDGGSSAALAIQPGLDDAVKTTTWFKGYRYYGAFQYRRLDGGNLTVVNFVPLEDYIKGILPYEMGSSWPLEALKAQAVCARTYTVMNLGKHDTYGFDLCNTTDCQVYHGVNGANSNSDRAVEETKGVYVWYHGELAQTFYFSCDGGGTESCGNVWNEDIPYLKGVSDPYEASVSSKISQYHWTVTYTASELKSILQKNSCACADIVNFYVSQRTDTGNVYSIAFEDSNGKTYTFSKQQVRNLLGLRSARYEIGGGNSGYYVDGMGTKLDTVSGLYAINGSGNTAVIGEAPYVVTGTGESQILTPGASGKDTYTVSGSGWGHLIGMSQWGAYAMASQGKTYDQILTFYFTGITIQ